MLTEDEKTQDIWGLKYVDQLNFFFVLDILIIDQVNLKDIRKERSLYKV